LVLKIMRSRSTCVKKGGGAAFFGVSEGIVSWHIHVVHYCAFLSFPKSPNLFRSIEVPNASPHLEGKLQGGGRPHHHDQANITPQYTAPIQCRAFLPSAHSYLPNED
jgi:hypothetical protein